MTTKRNERDAQSGDYEAAEPKLVLDDATLYWLDAGRVSCGLHAGMTARYSGYTIAGQRAKPLSDSDRRMARTHGYELKCEQCPAKPGAAAAARGAARLAWAQWIGPAQLACVLELTQPQAEEHEAMREILRHLRHRIEQMPKTYEQEKAGELAVAHLHYFAPAGDWWITERDIDTDGEGQVQCFGLATINGSPLELGYISIRELIAAGVELDLHWTPKTIAEIRDAHHGRDRAAARTLLSLSKVPTGNGEPEIWRDPAGRAYWSDGTRVTEDECARLPNCELLAAVVQREGLTVVGHADEEAAARGDETEVRP